MEGVAAMLVMVPGISGCCQWTCCPALLPRPAPFTEDIATLALPLGWGHTLVTLQTVSMQIPLHHNHSIKYTYPMIQYPKKMDS